MFPVWEREKSDASFPTITALYTKLFKLGFFSRIYIEEESMHKIMNFKNI